MNEKMKIGIISKYQLDDVKAWSGTIKNLSDLIETKYDVIPVIVDDGFLKIQYLRLIHRLTGIFFKSRITAVFDRIKLKKKMKRAVLEGCHVFLAIAASEIISAWKIPRGIKIIYLSDATYHQMLNYYLFNVSKHDIRICDKWESDAINRADMIIYSSDWAKKGAIEYYHCHPDKIKVMPFFPNIEYCAYSSDVYDRKGDIVNLLFVGVDWKRKGMDILLATMKILNERETKNTYILTVIGFDQPVDLNIPNVKFMGRLNKDIPSEMNKLLTCYKKADLFFLPTLAECAGIVFSEASMYALPIVTHDTGGVSTYVKDGYNGRTLPLGSTPEDFVQAIIEVSEPDQIKRYSANARKYYEEQLNKEKWLKEFEMIVQDQVNQN